MEESENINCASSQSEDVPVEIQFKTGFHFPEAHNDSTALAVLSKEMKLLRNEQFCRLPFCLTVEAEALGADINMGNMQTGPRIQSPIYQNGNELAAMEPMRFRQGRIKAVLDAVQLLDEAGEVVALTIEGPLTILSSLIAPEIVYKGLLKRDGNIISALEKITESIVAYGQQALLQGVKILSYADPLGNVDIIGPRLYKRYSGKLSHTILQQLSSKSSLAIIHLCGKASKAMENSGYCTPSLMTGSEKKCFGQLIKQDNGICQPWIIGHRCFRRTLNKDSGLWIIKLTDADKVQLKSD